MLDWTTSFLSDVIIIKPKSSRCQTVSSRTLYVVVIGCAATSGCRGGNKKPRSLVRGLTKTNPNRGNSPDTLINLDLRFSSSNLDAK